MDLVGRTVDDVVLDIREANPRDDHVDGGGNEYEGELLQELSPSPRRRRRGRRRRQRSRSGSRSSSGSSGSRNRTRYNSAGSKSSASSASSWGSILSSNMQRVRSISNIFSTKSTVGGGASDSDGDISTDSDVEWSTRILQRDTWFNQCSGEMIIDQLATAKKLRDIYKIYAEDWFHRILTQHTWVIVVGVMVTYTSYLLVFAGIYFAIRDPYSPTCAMDPDVSKIGTFQMAFAFALETAATSGYGFPSNATYAFWQACFHLPTVVWVQSWLGIFLNAFVIGFVYMRVGRADIRAHQVVFSDKACLVCSKGQFYLAFQVYDLDTMNPIVEAHVRTYCILNETDGVSRADFQLRNMRLQNPSDELGAQLFLSIPCAVVHAIDQWSPILPPDLRREHWVTHNDNFVHNASNRLQYPTLIQREWESFSGQRDGANCPICGMTYPTDEHLLRHVRYSQFMEEFMYKESADHDLVSPSTHDHELRHTELCTTAGIVEKVQADMKRKGMKNDGEEDDHQEEEEEEEDDDGDTHTHHSKTEMSGSEIKSVPSAPSRLIKRQSSYHSHHSIHSRPSSAYNMSVKHFSSQRKLAKEYLNEVKRGSSRKVHHHKAVRLNVQSTIDQELKELGDLSKPVGHSAVGLEHLQTHDRVVTTTELLEEEQIHKETEFSQQHNDNFHGVRKSKIVEDVRHRIKHYIEQSELEIIVIVEGIEAKASTTFQARHSYNADDIVFDQWFAPCLMKDPKTKRNTMNLNQFHQTIHVSYANNEEEIPLSSVL